MKKLLSIFCLSLFMMSMTISSEVKKEEQTANCLDRVHLLVTQATNSGYFTDEEIQWFGNGALAVYCYGYSWDDIVNAP